MSSTLRSQNGMAVAPHALAAQSALSILREGGTAIEAMVAAAATISVVYPHMTGIGGDAFWLIHEPGQPVSAIDACGPTAAGLTPAYYRDRGLDAIPVRGPLAANTVAGTVAGWDAALALSKDRWSGRMPLARLLEDAIHYAEHGTAVTRSQAHNTASKHDELAVQLGFKDRFLVSDTAPTEGTLFVQKDFGATFRELKRHGLDSFYRGEVAQAIAADLAEVGSPVTQSDLAAYYAQPRTPLALKHGLGTIYNTPPPTQGVVSLIILGILDRLRLDRCQPESADYIHLIVEATKQAFLVRDRHVTDPAYMTVGPQDLLDAKFLDALTNAVDRERARPWGKPSAPGDTVWMGTMDRQGRAVSFIQSIYHEFGSGVVLPRTSINWQNRGCSFSLDERALNVLKPGRKPFHTLNPAVALFNDGRSLVYGTMGGDGQPQTQAAVFTRVAVFGQPLQQAIAAPRWLLGRTWGQTTDTLKLEARFDPAIVDALRARGHDVETLGAFDETMGHAGAIMRHQSGVFEGGYDPRSDGAASGY